MAIVLIYPGQKADPVSLVEILRESHEESRKARALEIEQRTKRRVPLDDSTDFAVVDELLAEMQTEKRSAAKLNGLAQRLSAHTNNNELTPIDEFVVDDNLAGIKITLQIVSEAQRRDWSARSAVAWREYRDASVSQNTMALREADEKIAQIWRDQVCTCVVAIEGIEGLAATIAESMPALELAGLLIPLHNAVQYFLTLPPKKALRCGQPALSI